MSTARGGGIFLSEPVAIGAGRGSNKIAGRPGSRPLSRGPVEGTSIGDVVCAYVMCVEHGERARLFIRQLLDISAPVADVHASTRAWVLPAGPGAANDVVDLQGGVVGDTDSAVVWYAVGGGVSRGRGIGRGAPDKGKDLV